MRAARIVMAVVVTALTVVLTPRPAGAVVNGPCTGTVNGIDVGPLPVNDPSFAIKVQPEDTITYDVNSPVGVRTRSFVLSFAGFNLTVDSGSSSKSNGAEGRAGAVVVDDYAWMGAGLYQVAGVAHLTNGTTCSGAVLIDVQGNPLGTVGGVIGVILTVLGGSGIIVGTIRRGGGRLVRDLIDYIELGGDIDDLVPADGGAGSGGGATTTGAAPPVTAGTSGTGTGADEPTEEPAAVTEEPPPEPDPKRRRHRPPVDVPVAAGSTTDAPTTPAVVPPPPVEPAGSTNGNTPEPVTAKADDPADAGGESGAGEEEGVKPPPLPGMTTVSTIGSTGKALTEAAEQLEGHIGELPITDEQKEKLTETLGIETIKEKLETVTEVTDTVEHFEAMGTETVDTMNRWGVNANGINGLLWLRTMTEATGRLGQKFTDNLVKPVIEPVAEAAGEIGVEVDADEVAHTILPVQEVAEEASKALLQAGKNVLGGDNILNQLGQDPVVDEEWRAIRSFQ